MQNLLPDLGSFVETGKDFRALPGLVNGTRCFFSGKNLHAIHAPLYSISFSLVPPYLFASLWILSWIDYLFKLSTCFSIKVSEFLFFIYRNFQLYSGYNCNVLVTQTGNKFSYLMSAISYLISVCERGKVCNIT
jgi:hypothetical protein